MIVLLVGPSGVGKTSAYKAIESQFRHKVVFRELDDLAVRWAKESGITREGTIQDLRHQLRQPQPHEDELFLAFGLEAVGWLAGTNPGMHLVVDVGAGFQAAWFAENLNCLHATITLWAEPEIAHARHHKHRNPDRGREGFMQAEFNEHRGRVYARSRRRIDTTGKTLEQTADELGDILERILGPGSRHKPGTEAKPDGAGQADR